MINKCPKDHVVMLKTFVRSAEFYAKAKAEYDRKEASEARRRQIEENEGQNEVPPSTENEGPSDVPPPSGNEGQNNASTSTASSQSAPPSPPHEEIEEFADLGVGGFYELGYAQKKPSGWSLLWLALLGVAQICFGLLLANCGCINMSYTFISVDFNF